MWDSSISRPKSRTTQGAQPVLASIARRPTSGQSAPATRRLAGDEIKGLRQSAPRSRVSAALQAKTAQAKTPSGILADERLDTDLLRANGFDARRFERDAAKIRAGTLTEAGALVTSPLSPVSGVPSLEITGPEAARLRTIGEGALRRGEVAVVVLNGGMATRFGGVVKGVVEVFGGKSFLELKAEDVRRASETFGASIPLVLMNSFATHASTMEHAASKESFGLSADQLLTFKQSISVRMNQDGSVFIGKDGKPSYHAPGHGDFFEQIKRSGVLDELLERGVRTILFSNVDNLGATIDPVVIGHHIASGADMTAEVAEKRKTVAGEWDKGASPVVIDGRVQLVEGFRLPSDLSPIDFPDLSTNNFVFSAHALKQDIPMERYVVQKKVDKQPVLQLESITCEASGALGPDGEPLLALGLLRVPRDGAHGRFFPIKEPSDLEASKTTLEERLTQGWSRRDADRA